MVHDPMNEFLKQEPPQISTCGIIAQEVLQGLRSEEEFHYVEIRLAMISWLETARSSYVSAAVLSRNIRRRGMKVSSIDALIAAVAIQHDAMLWTLDHDFDPICSFSDLKLYR